MRNEDFNEKYSDNLTDGAKGLDVPLSYDVMKKLDEYFQEFQKRYFFNYSLLEYRNGKGYFEAKGLTVDEMWMIEDLLTNNK